MRGYASGRRALALAAAALAASLAAPLAARADIVHLADGRKLEGEVKLEGDTYVITGRFGVKTRVPKHMVVRVEKTESLRAKFAKARKLVEAKGEKATADDWVKLGKLATRMSLRDEAREAYEKVVSLERDHEEAREALGHVPYEGKWMPEAEAMALQGKLRVRGRWVDKEEAEAAKEKPKERRRREAADRPDQAKAMIEAIPDWQTCPACNGTAMAVWIPCHQCDRSGKPGYSNLGDKYALCMRCRGTAKLGGIKCAQCRGTGKVDPKRPRTPKGRYIPSGRKLCPTCNGTGVEAWTKCLQCARSKHPGFCYFGDHYEICRKCGGYAKVVALKCARCQRSGLVRER